MREQRHGRLADVAQRPLEFQRAVDDASELGEIGLLL
jgi:hypothetical protein